MCGFVKFATLQLYARTIDHFFFNPFVSHQLIIVTLRVTGGEIAGGSALAPKIGPLGLVKKLKKYLQLTANIIISPLSLLSVPQEGR